MIAKTNKGFSLIELLVVIAIVTILAAVATPAYKRYIMTSRLAKLQPVVDGILNQMLTYANAHGRYPTAYEIGLSTQFNSTEADNPSAIFPSMQNVTVQDFSFWIGLNNCGALGNLYIWTNNASTYGIPNGRIVLSCFLENYGNVINKKCLYTLGDGDNSIPGSILPGWTNYNTGINYDYSNWQSLSTSPEFTDAQCM